MSVGAIEGNQKIDHYGYRAEGEDSTQSLKCYATRFDGSGSYIDFVTTINRFEQVVELFLRLRDLYRQTDSRATSAPRGNSIHSKNYRKRRQQIRLLLLQ